MASTGAQSVFCHSEYHWRICSSCDERVALARDWQPAPAPTTAALANAAPLAASRERRDIAFVVIPVSNLTPDLADKAM
jgi:hypothetical protein